MSQERGVAQEPGERLLALGIGVNQREQVPLHQHHGREGVSQTHVIPLSHGMQCQQAKRRLIVTAV